MAKEDNKTRRTGRRAYLNDIQPSLSGEYVYVGAHYRFVAEEKTYLRSMLEISVLAFLSLAGFLAAGFVRAGGMSNCIYVLVPYMAEAIAVFTLLLALGKALIKGRRLREYEYEASIVKLPVRALLSAVFSAVGLIGIIIFVIINGAGGSVAELVVLLVGKVVSVVAPVALRKLMAALHWEKE